MKVSRLKQLSVALWVLMLATSLGWSLVAEWIAGDNVAAHFVMAFLGWVAIGFVFMVAFILPLTTKIKRAEFEYRQQVARDVVKTWSEWDARDRQGDQ